MSDLELLRDIGRQLRKPVFDELVETRHRRTRQSRLVGASTLALVAVATAGVLTSTGQGNRTDPPPTGPSPTSTSSPTATPDEGLDIPAGQQTVVPDIGPGDVRGYDELAVLTNSQPEHEGESELSTTVATRNGAAFPVVYCRGSADLMYIYEREDGASGVDSCAPDADTTLAPGYDISDEVFTDPAVPLRMRMWIARPSQTWLDCWHQGTSDCDATYGAPPPVPAPDVDFGFAVYEHRPAPALSLFERSYDAVSTIRQAAWLLDRAVVAASDADRLAFELSVSGEYLIDVYQSQSPHFEKCRLAHRDELPDYETTQSAEYWAAVDALCGTSLRLMVDGTAVAEDTRGVRDKGHFTDLGTLLTSGAPHQVEVTVTRGDPRNVRYAVVVRTRTELP